MNRPVRAMIVMGVAIILLLPCGMLLGSVFLSPAEIFDAFFRDDGVNRFIVVDTRMPALVTSVFAGAALAVAGLMMQTCFSNPLAGPTIMGISTGASLGVAVVLLAFGGLVGMWGRLAVGIGAMAGAMIVLFVLLFFSGFVRNSDILLIIGILVGYLTSSAISILNYFSASQAVHSYVVWGLGTFNTVDLSSLPWFTGTIAVFIIMSLCCSKSLNVLLFGHDYAKVAGMSVVRVRTIILLLSGALTAIVTASCGPVGFIGLIVPHVARMATKTSNHHLLMPATVLGGALVGLLCQMLSVAPAMWFSGMLPINAITPLLGVPVIVYVLMRRRNLNYFN